MKKRITLSFFLLLLIHTAYLFGQTLSPNTTGSFVFTPTGSLSSKPITVFYHIPNGNISTMPILFSFHGDERNAIDYRDYWISMANANGFMVFAPEYSETHYPGGDQYQLGNVFDDGDNPSLATFNPSNEWTFSTIDPLFEAIKTSVSGVQQNYDAWGHSGGAQFLQRFRMYLPNSKMNTAICSNAGWYTVPESPINFPYGINNGQLSNNNLAVAFSKKIIVHLGLNDTDPNSIGLRHNTTVDNQQGLYRLERGRYFFNKSQAVSQTLSNNFNWQREEVTGVGHDPQLMANDALEFLFQTNSNNISQYILDGGFENHSIGNVQAGTASAINLSTTSWSASTTSGTAITRAILATGGRTGSQCASFGSSSTTTKSFYTPQIAGAFAPNTTYQIQFWYKPTTITANLASSTVDLYVDNNSATAAPASIGTKQSVVSGLDKTKTDWTKVAVSITTNATAAGSFGLAAISFTTVASSTNFTASFDDFVIYQATSADTTAPNSPGAITAAGAVSGGSNVSWVGASGGVDGGGYVVVRYATTAPSASDDLVQNGIYKFANTVGAGVVRYIGSGTSFTDSGLSPGVDYYYKVYTVDKAFNYSDESVTSTPVQSLATTYYYNGTGLLTDVSSWGQNTNGTGTAPTNFTDASQVFEIRNTTAVALDGVWTVGLDPANGTKVRLGNTDQAAITLTLNSGSSIGPAGTGNFDVMTPSSGHQTVIYKNTTALSLGTILDADFEVIYDGVTVSSATTKSFGTISIINGGNVTFSATPVIKNITVDASSILVTPTSASSAFITIPSGGSVVINGTVRVPKLSGFVASNVVTPNDSFGAIQFVGSENLTLGANSVVEYVRTATGAQTVTARTDYKNVIFTGTTPKTVNGPTTVSGTLTVNQSTAVTLTGDLTVNGTLTFVLGKITTGVNTVTIGTSGIITGADQFTGWVVGNLKKQTTSSASPSFTYAIGDSNNYTPLALTFTGNTSAIGGLTAKINIGDHAQVATSGIDNTKSVNKTWTLTNDSLTGFGTYSAAFTYSNADIDGISIPANYVARLYDGSTWSNVAVLGIPTDTVTTATGITGFGDFAIGECVPTTTGSESVTACGSSYIWATSGATYNSSGTYTHVVGCNTATLTLTLTPETTNTTTVSSFQTYTWANNGETYTTSGIKTGTTTDCVTELLDLTITTTLPAPVVQNTSRCKVTVGVAPTATALPDYSLVWYSSATSSTALTATPLITSSTKTYWVAQRLGAGPISPRAQVTTTVNQLPATPASMTTTDAVLCKHIGTTNAVTYSVPVVAAIEEYSWSLPSGVTATSAIDTNTITVNFAGSALNNTSVGGIGTISARAISAQGCLSAPRALVLTSKLPTAPTSLTLTSADTNANFNSGLPSVPTSLSQLSKITKVGAYMDTDIIFTLTAPVAPTAASYAWTLPAGVNQLTGGTSNVITIDFAGVEPGIGILPIVVKSVGGCGQSAARTLSLSRALPTAPTALVLTDGVSPIALTKVSAYTGKTTPLTLTASPARVQGATATSYAWRLPAGVNIVSPATTATTISVIENQGTVEVPNLVTVSYAALSTGTDSTITVNFAGVASGTLSFPLTVYAVNGTGNSKARTRTVTAAAPTSPAITAVGGTTFNSCTTKTYSVVQTLGTSYAWTIPAGASASSLTGNTIVVDYTNVTALVGETVQVTCTASNGTGSSAPKLLNVKRVFATCRLSDSSASAFSAKAYPNPSSSEFKIETSAKGAMSVKVYDMQGRLVEKANSDKVGARLAKGVYNVIVNQGANTKSVRVIKN